MLRSLAIVFVVLLASVVPARGGSARMQSGDDPRTVLRAATRAVWGDSAAPLRTRWAARFARDSSDRAAAFGLATLARLTYDYDAAERLYRRLFADSLHPDRFTALAHLGLARQLERRGFGVQAPPQFTRARELARTLADSTTEGEALTFLAFVRARTEGLAVGDALLDTAWRLLPDTAFALRSLILNRRAVILSLRGQPQPALAEAERAIAFARRAGDPGAEADCLRALGQLLVQHQRFDSGMVVLQHAEDLYRRINDGGALAAHLVWRAEALGSLGRYGEMREVMRSALREGEAARNPVAVAVAYRSLGALGILMGDFAGAGAHLRRSDSVSRSTGNSLAVMTTQKFLADVALAAGNGAEARRLAQEQLAFGRRMGDPLEQHDAHVLLASIAIGERDWTAAERAIADARSVISGVAGASRLLWLRYHEGRLAHARGDLASAERAFTALLRDSSAAAMAGNDQFDLRLRLADIHAARGEVAAAEREMTRASDAIDAWRSTLDDPELRILAFQANPSQHARAVDPSEQSARVARVLAALVAGGRAEAAFTLAERRRARELGDQLARAAGLRIDTTRASAPAVRTALGASPTTAGDVAARLGDDRIAILEFVGGVDGAPTTLFVVRRGGLHARVLPAADSLSDRVARFAALLEAGHGVEVLARSLGATLVDSAVAAFGPNVARLVVVPDGMLHDVPWDALRLADGRFVAERFAVTIAPSAGVVSTLWRRPGAPDTATVRLLAFGDPAFPDEKSSRGAGLLSAAAETYRSAFDSTGGLPRLRASADEARRVARYASAADVRLREEASAAFLKHAPLRQYRVIHLATHALVDERTGTRTALALAPSAGESGFVGAGDLAALALDADLVVLSACRSARGKLVEGEGVQGLTAPLLQAGARAVIATQWRIGDRRTVAFVDALYAGLARGLAVAEALRAAKLDAIRRGAGPTEWAAFTLVGDPTVTIPLRQPAPVPNRWWLVAAALLVGGVVAAAYRGTKARRKAAPLPTRAMSRGRTPLSTPLYR